MSTKYSYIYIHLSVKTAAENMVKQKPKYQILYKNLKYVDKISAKNKNKNAWMQFSTSNTTTEAMKEKESNEHTHLFAFSSPGLLCRAGFKSLGPRLGQAGQA